MNKFIISLFSIVIFSFGLKAKEKDISPKAVDVISGTTADVIEADSLQQEICHLKDLIEKYEQSVNSLNGKLYDYEQTIKEQNKKIERQNSYILFADTIIARLSNDCLRMKYDKNRVNQAIENFDKMYSPKLRSKFGRLKYLLNEYGEFTQELVDIFIESQNDRKLGNPFTGQKQALTYIDKIKGTRYYKEVYSNNWTIPYLNKLIDKCFETIKAFNPKENKELHLIELMN